MSEFDKFYSSELDPYEQDVDNYNVLIETWNSYRDKEDAMLSAISLAMSGQGGDTLGDAIAAIMHSKHEYLEDLVDLSEVIFDEIDHDEAVEIWANVIDQSQKSLLRLIQFIDSRASFSLVPMSELKINADAYGIGRERARAEGALYDDAGEEDANEPQTSKIEQIGIEQLHEILEDDDIEWDNLSEVSEGDEYAEWVLDEIFENLETRIENLLELVPADLYKNN